MQTAAGEHVFLAAEWRYLAMLNYEVDPEGLVRIGKHLDPAIAWNTSSPIDSMTSKLLISVCDGTELCSRC